MFVTVTDPKTNTTSKVPDIDAAICAIADERRAIQAREPLPDATVIEPIHEVAEDPNGKQIAKPLEIVTEDIINPRVLHLCTQVSSELPEQSRMPAASLVAELNQISAQLSVDDWEYVRSHGFYPTVKKLAKAKISELASAE